MMNLRRTHLVLALVAALVAPVTASADTTYTFTGHGYGHGVGMGQYGAQGYALQGWTHQRILAHYYQGTTLGPSGVAQVRVLLQEKLAQPSASSPAGLAATDEGGPATVTSPGPGAVSVRKDADGLTLLDAAGAVLARGWTGPVSLAAVDGSPVTLAGAALNYVRDGRYRGRVRVLDGGDGLSVVNVVSLESYLLGVVAREMPSTWKPEALESQAIAARTYAVATRRGAASPFDMYPDQRSQVYGGISAEGAAASAAVGGDRRAGRALPGPADRDVLLVLLGRPYRRDRGGVPGRQARAVPLVGRRPLRHDLALPRLDALAERPRRRPEGRLPRPRDRPARGCIPVGPRAHGDADGNRRGARAGLRARSQALRPAFDLVRSDAVGAPRPRSARSR